MMQPQTLQGAQFLLYLNAAFGLIYFLTRQDVLWLVPIVGAGAAFGIANEKRWGWYLGVGVSVLWLVIELVYFRFNIISILFSVLLVVLLVHPMTRNYQKIWFK